MARIELRNCTVRVKDGLSGTGAINEPTTPPAQNDTDFDIDTIVLNTQDTDKVPLGARFTVAGETAATTVHTVTARTPASASPTTNIVFTPPVATDATLMIDGISLNTADTDLVPIGARFTIAGETAATTVHTVTARTPADAGPTTEITFAPALGAGTYADGGALTFQAQQIEIKVGDGEVKYTEANEYKYDKDRGNLDTVREGDEVPMDVSLNFTFEHVKTGTGEAITPIDAIKGTGGASEWVTSSSDPCEPYAVDIEVEHVPPCGSADTETILFPDFRSEKRDYDFKNAMIAVSGKCNATEPEITRA